MPVYALIVVRLTRLEPHSSQRKSGQISGQVLERFPDQRMAHRTVLLQPGVQYSGQPVTYTKEAGYAVYPVR